MTTKQKWKRPTVKDIRKLEGQLANEKSSHARTDEMRRNARSDAFRDFARDADIIKEASNMVARKLGEQLGMQIMYPVVTMMRARGLSDNMCSRIAETVSQMLGRELGNTAWQALEEWRADRSLPLVTLDMEAHYAKPVQVLRGEVKRINYCVEMKS